MKFKKPLILVLLLCLISATAAFLFTACGNGNDKTDEHKHSYTEIVIPPTCTERGCSTYVCTAGDDIYIDNYVNALGHDYVDGFCTRCNDEHKHSYTKIVSLPTCTERGYTIFVCTAGDDIYIDNYVNAFGHDYVDGFCTRCNEQKTSEGLEYVLSADGKGYSVAGVGTCADAEIIIASEYNGLPVTAINNYAFNNRSYITNITIPDSVTSIGSSAFFGCTAEIIWGDNPKITEIGEYAFSGYKGTNITIPDSVTSIGEYAFSDCTSLVSIVIPDCVTSIGDRAFEDCTSFNAVYITDIASWCNISFLGIYANPLRYAHNLYLNNELITELEIPDSVTSICGGAFWGCTSIVSITIPNSVTAIGMDAFSGCSSLASITIPNSVTFINWSTFEDCTSLVSITIPDSVTAIGDRAFYGCTSLESVTIPNSVTTIGAWAFYGCTSLESITIPDKVTTIGAWAFAYCISLESVTIPDSVTTIGAWVFAHCTNLESVIFENADGWFVSEHSSATSGTNISSSDLENPATAATYLRIKYRYCYWEKN